ncbi:protein AGENET DOMAIN (AGD)-CONTAINING P1-like [Macadamia integrifolia]|uniref:protein AGENET DOMAIN (AGD)-CONTAINING P1-like n=1 Tax=Macadamia integrifolia TaxID=60698 RepID=UPI001C52CAAD|nr:protein AGENET DOMAIN (AGD)-CONTAINING P1-like [Macadamia integrifolia]
MKNPSKDLMRYRIGDSVEVHSKEEGFVGSFYAAKVVDVSKNNHVLVEYKTLLTDDESKWLREMVHVSEVRPRPPQLQVSKFNLWDIVDAYDNEGWWVGRISSIAESKYYACFDGGYRKGLIDDDGDEIPDQKRRRLIDESKYYVYFSSTPDAIAYPFSRLRLHQEWKNGNWVVPSGSSSFLP